MVSPGARSVVDRAWLRGTSVPASIRSIRGTSRPSNAPIWDSLRRPALARNRLVTCFRTSCCGESPFAALADSAIELGDTAATMASIAPYESSGLQPTAIGLQEAAQTSFHG